MSIINSNINHKGLSFHIQTQDKGAKAKYIESLIFREGRLLSLRKTPYYSLLNRPDLEKQIQQLMRDQHQSVINDLSNGKFDHFLKTPGKPEVKREGLLKTRPSLEIKLFHLSIPSMSEPVKLSLEVKNAASSKPVSLTKITVSAIPESGVKYLLFLGQTDREGKLNMSRSLPRFLDKKFILSINAEKEGFEENEMNIILEKI